MYELLGVLAVLFVVWTYRFRVSQILLVVAAYNLSVAAVAWHHANIDGWFGALGISALSLTGVSIAEFVGSSFLNDSYRAMPKRTSCCIPKFGCSSPDSVLFLTCLFRGLAGASAATSFYVSWSFRRTFWSGRTDTVVGVWSATCLLWLLSCVPHFICLLQCAATKESAQILEFRKRITIWLVHDVVLGLFWLYLSSTLHHLLKDDDSEWRTVFLSMLSWHIIIFVCRQLYLTDVWRVTKHVACCASETVGRWSVVLVLTGLCMMYGVMVHVVRDSVDMGCSVPQVIIYVSALVVGSVGYLMSGQRPPAKLKRDGAALPPQLPLTQLDF